MSELVCSNPQCGHGADLHDDQLGVCLVLKCGCIAYRSDDGFDLDEPDEIEPLNFDHGQ